MVSIRGNSETRDDAVQNARSRPAKQPVLQAGGRKKGRQIYHNAPLCAVMVLTRPEWYLQSKERRLSVAFIT